MWKRSESTEVLRWIWKIVRTSGKILATAMKIKKSSSCITQFGIILLPTGTLNFNFYEALSVSPLVGARL